MRNIAALILLMLFSGTSTLYAEQGSGGYRWLPVSGTGIHYFSTATIHTREDTATGYIQRSTDIIELDGDLQGRVLYHPVSVFNLAAGTLVNTGHQVFSGTVLGSSPVLIYDDEYRFEVNLNTGETIGKVYLADPIAGPRIRCELDAWSTGVTPAGDARIAYTGRCKLKP